MESNQRIRPMPDFDKIRQAHPYEKLDPELLGVDVLSIIFSYLKPLELVNASRVSKKWQSGINDLLIKAEPLGHIFNCLNPLQVHEPKEKIKYPSPIDRKDGVVEPFCLNDLIFERFAQDE